jgi:transcriptional regulator with XRE-family HTH domain
MCTVNGPSTTVSVQVNARLGSREQDSTTETPLEEFAAALRERLDVLGVSRNELARRTGLSPSAISNYTIGRDTPPPPTVFAIEDALGCKDLAIIFGYRRATDGDHPPGFVEALMADPYLKPDHKRSLLGLYRGLIATLEG